MQKIQLKSSKIKKTAVFSFVYSMKKDLEFELKFLYNLFN